MNKLFGIAVIAGGLFFGWYSDAHLATSEKINQAFPPSAEVRISLENLDALIADDQETYKSFHDNFDNKLALRALTCSQGLSVGRFDSIKKVKSLTMDKDCINQQDAVLFDLIGTKFVAIQLAQPALRPLAKLGPPSAIHGIDGIDISTGFAASEAGVAVLRGGRGDYFSIQIPGGAKISKLPTVPDVYANVSLSPNGRVSAMPVANREVLFVDNETGKVLWRTSQFSQVLVWLPELSSALVKETKSGALLVADFATGKIQPNSVALRNSSWGLRVNDNPSRVLIGSGREFTLMENKRTSGTVDSTSVKEYGINTQRGSVSSLTPTLMDDKKAVFFVSGNNFMQVNLDTSEEKQWESEGIIASRYAKLSEVLLLVSVTNSLTNGGLKNYSFNLKDSTLSPVQNDVQSNGMILELDGRNGFMIREYNKMTVGDELTLGSPIALSALISNRNLERQMAQLQQESKMLQQRLEAEKIMSAMKGRQLPPGYNPHLQGDSQGYYATEPAPRADSMGVYRQGRAIGSAQFEAELAAKRQTVTSLATQRIGVIPANARVEAVGVYETKDRSPSGVNIIIKKSDKPIVLMLSAYEPVKWNIIKETGANLVAVVATSYNLPTVTGAGSAKLIIKRGSYAYERNSQQYELINGEALMWTGKPISKFQGAYGGTNFVVGG